jgi:hypothetical protein
MTPKLALVCIALVLVLAMHRALARAQVDLPYGLAESFSTAVRFVRVERGCKVTDKDAEAAFVAFECSDDGKIKRGTLELFRTGAAVRAQITLGDETHGMELRWLELLERKLRDERGTPPPPSPPPPPPPPSDKGPPRDLGA